MPSAWSSYDMKTRFPNSRKRSHFAQPGRQPSAQPTSAPQSQYISESGPHGPGPPTDQKFSDDGSGTIRSRRHPDLLPEADRLLVGAELELRVAGVDADPDAIPVELQPLLDELGRVLDRALLEVLAEREVAEHLEEREVERVEADLVDVGRAEDLLARRRERRRRRLAAEEERHLRLHPRARVERRAVVGARDERVRRAAQMSLLLEERLEPLAQLGRRPHDGHSRRVSAPTPRCRAAQCSPAGTLGGAGPPVWALTDVAPDGGVSVPDHPPDRVASLLFDVDPCPSGCPSASVMAIGTTAQSVAAGEGDVADRCGASPARSSCLGCVP